MHSTTRRLVLACEPLTRGSLVIHDETTASRRTRRPRILATPRYGISLFTTTRTRAPTYIHLSLELENLEAPHGVPSASQAVKPALELSRQFCGIGIRDVGVACVVGGRRHRWMADRRAPGILSYGNSWHFAPMAEPRIGRAPCTVRRAPARVDQARARTGAARACRGVPLAAGDRAAAGRC